MRLFFSTHLQIAGKKKPRCRRTAKEGLKNAGASTILSRDEKTEKELKALGWKLIVIWSCETTKKKFPPQSLIDFIADQKGRNFTIQHVGLKK
ncbi:MAG: hypothetical protein MJ033_02180 [Victivallaceae bacterium]|nr:hypothetical protein [Victivallaceae bacterium]